MSKLVNCLFVVGWKGRWVIFEKEADPEIW